MLRDVVHLDHADKKQYCSSNSNMIKGFQMQKQEPSVLLIRLDIAIPLCWSAGS